MRALGSVPAFVSGAAHSSGAPGGAGRELRSGHSFGRPLSTEGSWGCVGGEEREDDGDLAEREVRPSLEREFAASGGLVRGSGAGCLRRERGWE